MYRLAIALCLFSIGLPAFAQTQQQPSPNFPKKEFFGDALAILSFCNFHDVTDRYEMFVAFKELGVTSADRSEILSIRDKNYQIYRNKFNTPATHEEVCKGARTQFFFIKTPRKGVPIVSGSDTGKQPEKIEVFGNALGAMLFCKSKIDLEKWWNFMFDMGVKSESVSALTDQASIAERGLVAQYGTPQNASEVCSKVTNNFVPNSFIKP